MNWTRFLRRETADAEQQKELEFYVEVTSEEYVAGGWIPRPPARRRGGSWATRR